jgi:AcrR family transcriptional regulator
MATMTNDERSATTQALVLDATIEALVKYGYHGATSARIAEISGLSRGAQLHHWKTKAELVVAALLHLHEKRMEMYARIWDPPAGATSIRTLVEDAWKSFDDPIWLAAAELWTAARTDAELRAALVPAEREISKRIREQLAPVLASGEAGAGLQVLTAQRFGAVYGLIMSTMRGIALHEAFDPDPKRAKAQRTELIRALTALVEVEQQRSNE